MTANQPKNDGHALEQAALTRLPSNFWRHFAASVSSNLGDGMVAAAAPLLALSLTNDTRLIAAVSAAAMVPWLVLSLPAGVFIDRHERRNILTASNGVRAALFGVLALSIVLDLITIWLLLVIVLLLAVGEVFFDMAGQAFLPSIVDESLLERANGRLYAAEVAANSFVGLPVGAWLFVVAAAAPFGLQATALLVAAALIASIHLPRHANQAHGTHDARPQRRLTTEIREGLRWLWSHPFLRLLALMLGAANMCHMFAQSIFAKFVRDELGLGPRSFGLLLSASAIGSIVGGLVGSRIARKLGAAAAIVGAYVMFAALEILPGAVPQVWAVVVAGVLMSVSGTVWNVLTVSARQRLIPSDLFGRVNSVYRFIGTGTSAFGALIGGQIAFHFGLRATYLVSGASLSIVLIFGAPRLLALSKRYASTN
jgi:MFS family permease